MSLEAKKLFDLLGLEFDEARHHFQISELRLNLSQRLGAELLQPPHQYRVPRISEDNTCGFGMVQNPFELKWAFELHDKNLLRLSRLYTALHWLNEKVHLDWLGLYQKCEGLSQPSFIDDNYGNELDQPNLIKLCYIGAPSRAAFPLTQEFARQSNNSRAFLNQQPLLIQDVKEAVADGAPYYECDPAVKSELCLPLIWQGLEIGLFDGEAFTKNFFDGDKINACLALADFIAEEGLLV
ncbi:MAG: hypothetical protein H6624_04235 [Bdellovibrionaceae bacterium]|nr:hypothetical protein [Bdellovibrionales bacterium]MCB9083524.1 hypothetical protein [Pseudobdellovibrionaceae bacterium]